MSVESTRPSGFLDTPWTLLMKAKGEDTPKVHAAFELLAQRYWKSVYFFLRRRGYDSQTSQDLTQGFLLKFWERGYLRRADPAQGRFRSFLLRALEWYLHDERDRRQAEQRGGPGPHFSLQFETAEQEYALEPASPESPERIFRARWIRDLMAAALRVLQAELAAEGREALFRLFVSVFEPDPEPARTDELAARFRMTPSEVRNGLHRTRNRFRETLLRQIRATVDTDDDFRAELRELGVELGLRPEAKEE